LELVESKLHPPPARPGMVARTGLVDRLLASDAVPVVGVVAPVGYGKTTLLAQWAQRTAHRVGWVSVDERDNDPAVLLTYLAVALDRVEPIDPRVIRGLAGLGASIMGAVPRLAAAMAAMTGPVALVLDHLEVLENQACLDVVAELAAQLPPGAQLLLAPGSGRRCRWRCCASRARWWSSGSRNWRWTTGRPGPCWRVPASGSTTPRSTS
jgi:LuxR family maltose regulon positive regulatory protein